MQIKNSNKDKTIPAYYMLGICYGICVLLAAICATLFILDKEVAPLIYIMIVWIIALIVIIGIFLRYYVFFNKWRMENNITLY